MVARASMRMARGSHGSRASSLRLISRQNASTTGTEPQPHLALAPHLSPALAMSLTLNPAGLPTRTRLAPLPLRCAEGGWLRPQAEEALITAAKDGDLATLKRLVEEGVSVNAADK
eukprot:scaffold44873_cov42-Phaeocystis_antarctica.AAC.2